MGQRLEAGESLARVFSDHDPAFPPLYCAVVEAGLRSGRLAVALEGLSASAAGGFAAAAGRLLVGLPAVRRGPGLRLAGADDDPLGARDGRRLPRTSSCLAVACSTGSTPARRDGIHLGAVASRGGVAVTGFLWIDPARSASAADNVRRCEPCPSLAESLTAAFYAGRLATFADVMALLVEQEVPLDEAVILAADSSGDQGLRDTSRELAEWIRRGQPMSGWGQLERAERIPTLARLANPDRLQAASFKPIAPPANCPGCVSPAGSPHDRLDDRICRSCCPPAWGAPPRCSTRCPCSPLGSSCCIRLALPPEPSLGFPARPGLGQVDG